METGCRGRPSWSPVFDGSGLVGGADADFILGNRFYEIKAVLRPRDKLPDRLRQLIGYLLLDWNDRYGLETAGFYFARQGEFVSWPVAFLIPETAGDARRCARSVQGPCRGAGGSTVPGRQSRPR